MTHVIFLVLGNKRFSDFISALFVRRVCNVRIRLSRAKASSTHLTTVPKIVVCNGRQVCELFWARPPLFMLQFVTFIVSIDCPYFIVLRVL